MLTIRRRRLARRCLNRWLRLAVLIAGVGLWYPIIVGAGLLWSLLP
jgi:hypothetical protein